MPLPFLNGKLKRGKRRINPFTPLFIFDYFLELANSFVAHPAMKIRRRFHSRFGPKTTFLPNV